MMNELDSTLAARQTVTLVRLRETLWDYLSKSGEDDSTELHGVRVSQTLGLIVFPTHDVYSKIHNDLFS